MSQRGGVKGAREDLFAVGLVREGMRPCLLMVVAQKQSRPGGKKGKILAEKRNGTGNSESNWGRRETHQQKKKERCIEKKFLGPEDGTRVAVPGKPETPKKNRNTPRERGGAFPSAK